MASTNPLDSIWTSAAIPPPAAQTPAENPLDEIWTHPLPSSQPQTQMASNPLDKIWAPPAPSQPTESQPQANPLDAIWSKPITPTAAPAQPAQPDSTWSKIWAFANHPIVNIHVEQNPLITGGEAAKNYLENTDHPTLAKIAGAYTGAQRAAGDIVQGLLSPLNLAAMAASGGLGAMKGVAGPVVARLVNLGFSAQGIYQAYKNIPEIKKALQSGDVENAARLLTSTAGNVGMSAMAGLHALGEVNPVETVKGVEPLRNAPVAKIVDTEAAKLHAEEQTAAPAEKPAPKETPLRAFHGTSGDVTDVRELVPGERVGTLGKGVYFTTEPKVSGQYAGPENVATGGRVIAGEIAPDTKLLDADAKLPEPLQKTLTEKFGEGSDTYRGFLESTIGDKAGIEELQDAVFKEGYRGVRSEDVHGAPGLMLFGDAKDLSPVLPTARVMADSYVPVVSKDAILSEATARIARNSPVLQQIIDPAKIQTPADITTALNDAANHIQRNLDPRIGARISFEAQKNLAADLGMSVEDLLSRKSGEAFGPEQAIAARSMLKSSADNVLDLARKAAGGDVDARQQLALNIAKHQEISNQIAGVTSEAGRTLGSFRIADADLPQLKIARAMGQLKPGALDEASKLLANLDPADPNYTRKANEFINEITPSTTADKLFEVYRNSLLSSPGTVIKKTASEATMMALEATKKFVVGTAEAAKQAAGISDAEAFPSESWFYGKGAAQGLANARAVLSGEFNLQDAPGFEHAGETAIKGRAGKIINAPSELLSRMTNLIYTMNYYGELNSLAARQAIQEGLEGEQLAARQEYLAQKPTPEMIKAANETGLHNTFQQKLGKTGSYVSAAIQSNPISRFLFPFFKTPVNLVKASGEYSPYGLLKGTAQGDLNLQAKGLIGSSIAAGIAYLAANGIITGGGPVNFKQRETKESTGWLPYAVKIGDKYYQYSKAEPLGLVLGLVADAVHGSLKDEDPAITNSKAVNAWNHISRNVSDLPFLMQVSSIVDSLTHLGDGHTAQRIVNNLLASAVVPAGAKNVAQALDRTIRNPQGLAQTIESRVPGLTKNVPATIDVTGKPAQRPTSSLGGANPFLVTADKNNPTVKELARLGVTVENLPTNPITVKGYKGKRFAVPGATPTPQEAQVLQQQEQQKFFTLAARAIANPNWKALPDDQKKLVLSALHKKVAVDRLRRLQQLRGK